MVTFESFRAMLISPPLSRNLAQAYTTAFGRGESLIGCGASPMFTQRIHVRVQTPARSAVCFNEKRFESFIATETLPTHSTLCNS